MPRLSLPRTNSVPALLALLLTVAAGCSTADLGQLDETRSERDDMPGPGILANESGETILKWSNDSDRSATAAEQGVAPATGDRAEFEQFKKWNRLRTEDRNSAEYREFLQWLNYQEFKSGQ